jgi:hypothetical protein
MIGDALVAVATAAGTTPSVVLQAGEEIDLDPSYGANEFQIWFALLIAAGVIVFSALLVRYHSSRILAGEEADHARAVTSGLRSRDRNTLRIPNDGDVDGYRGRIRALFDDDFASDVPTVRHALGEVRSVWLERRRAATQVLKDETPALARALSLDGVLYLLAGVVAVESLNAWGALLTASSSPPSPAAILDRIATVVSESATTAVEIASSFPFAGDLWAFVFLGVVEGGTALYERPYLVAAALLVGSLLIWIGDRVVADDVDPRLYRSRPKAAFGVVAVVVSTWFVGVGVATALRAVHSTIGSLATGLLVAIVVAAIVASKANPYVDETRRRVAAWKTHDDVVSAEEKAFTLESSLEEYDARRRPKAPETTPSSRWSGRGVGFPVLRTLATVGVVATSFAAVGIAAYLPTLLGVGVWGAACGLFASAVVAWVMARRELRAAYDRLSTAHDQADDQGVRKTGTTAYVAARKVFGLLGGVAGLILPVYVFQALTTGKAAAIFELAATQSSLQAKTAFGVVVIALVAFTIMQTRSAWRELSTATQYALDRQGLRLVLKTRGIPLLAVLLTFPMLWGSGLLGPLESALAAVGVGIVLRAFTWLASRADHAYAELDMSMPTPGRVFVEATIVEDDRGQEIAVADLNGKEIAAPTDRLDELVDQVVADTKSIFDDVRSNPSVYAYYRERLEDGKTDFDDVLVEYRGTISKAIDAELAKAGRDGVDVERLDEIMTKQYDPTEYKRKRLEKRKKPDGIVISDGRVRSS